MNMTLILKRLWAGVQACLFVAVTLGIWWGVASLTNGVARCVPWKLTGDTCRPLARPLVDAGGNPRVDDKGNLIYPSGALSPRTENALLILSLFPALWVAHRLLYSEQDDDAPAPKAQAPEARDSLKKTA